MKKFALAALMALAFLPLRAGKIVTDSLYSKVLKETVVFNVYLPDGFEKSKASYPVVYLLHGLSDNYTAWEKRGRMQTVTDHDKDLEDHTEVGAYTIALIPCCNTCREGKNKVQHKYFI